MKDLRWIIGAEDRASGVFHGVTNSIDGMKSSGAGMGTVFDKGFGGISIGASGLLGKVSLLAGEFLALKYAAETVFNGIAAVVGKGISAIETFQQSVIKTSALITSFQGGSSAGDIAQKYALAKDYATELQGVLETIDAKTIASAQDLGLITEEMVKQRVVLDINNQKQIDAFTNLANAAAVVTQGAGSKEIQMRQEIRALMQGEVNAQSVLASQINAMVGGGLKQKVEMWKQEGTLVENLGKALSGYAAASGDISSTWSAVKSTMETIVNKILREGFGNVFQEVVSSSQQITDYVKEHAELIGNRVKQGWLAVEGLLESCGSLIAGFQGPLSLAAEFVGAIARGWGLILYGILPPLLERVGVFIDSMWEIVKVAGYIGKMAWDALSLDFGAVVKDFEGMKASWRAAGAKTAEAFRGGLLDEMGDRVDKFMALDTVNKGNGKKVAPPDLGESPVTDAERASVKSATELLVKYGATIKEVGKSQLSMAEKKFSEDLKEQAEAFKEIGSVFGDLQDPVRRYLAVIDETEQAQKRLQESIISALETMGAGQAGRYKEETQKALAQENQALLQVEKSAAENRLKTWTSYYESLRDLVKSKNEQILELNKKMLEDRQTIVDAIAAVGQKLEVAPDLNPFEQYWTTFNKIQESIGKAVENVDQAEALASLREAKKEAEGLASAVSMDGAEVVSLMDAVNHSQELLRTIGEAMDTVHEKGISAAERDVSRLEDQMLVALTKMQDAEGIIQALEDKIAQMQKTIMLSADDKVSPVLDRIRDQLDTLQNTSITIGANYSPVYAPSSTPALFGDYGVDPFADVGFAVGTKYVAKTGYYKLHQGEEVKNRNEAGSAGKGASFSFGDMIFQFSGNADQQTADELAREVMGRIQVYAKRYLTA